MIRKTILIVMVGVCIYLIAAAVYAQTCTVDDSSSDRGMFEKLMPKRCLPEETRPMGKNAGTPVEDRQKTLQDAGISQETLAHMQILSHSPMYLDGPSGLLGQESLLELTEQQKKQLLNLMAEMRTRANDILTSQQRSRLGKVPSQPVSIDQICQEIRQQMAQNRNGNANDTLEFRCPICPGIQDNTTTPPSTQPSQNK
jgi:hypothetical protein